MAVEYPYAVSYATPETIDQLRYWCDSEFGRIEIAFNSHEQNYNGLFFKKEGDTWDLGATQIFPKDPAAPDTSDAEMAFINFFGINALRIQASTPNTPNGIGYLLLTDAQGESFSFIVGSKYDGFRVRNQIYRDDPTITDPQEPNVYEPDSIVTVDYALNKYVTSDTPTFTGIATFNDDASPAGGLVVNGSVLGVGINCSNLILGNGFNANAQRGVNFADPIDAQDVATKAYADSIGSGGLPPGPVDGAALRYDLGTTSWQGISGVTMTSAGQMTIGGGTSGGLIVTGTGAGFSIDATGVILGRAGFNANNTRIVAVAEPTAASDAATKNYVDTQGGGGVTDHGALTGLGDDDHTQYFNETRGDARYVTLSTTQTITASKTFDAQTTIGGGTSGGLIVTGSGAGVSIDATGQILARAGFNAFNQKLVALANGTAGTDAVNVNQLNGKANVSHTHDASATVSGTFNIARIPTGTTGTTVALGNHGHDSVYAPVSTTVTTNTTQTITGVKTFSAGFSASVGVVLNGGSINGGARVQGVGAPSVGGDAANKTYVDGAVSDRQLKKAISGEVDSSVIHKLRVVSFEYDKGEFEFPNSPKFRDGKHYGVVAQEAEHALPEAVYDSIFPGYKAFDYEMLVPLLVKEVQELRQRVELLETRGS